MDRNSNRNSPSGTGTSDGKRSKPGVRKGGRLDTGKLDDVAGGAVVSAFPPVTSSVVG